MEQLSLKSYGWKCVLGMEVFYAACLAYGSLLTDKAQELHHSLFELIPWFTWGSAASVVWGFVYFFVVAWVIAWYIVWMHNSSLIKK